MTEKDIVEIIGDGDLKAIRLNTGKVIGCQILIIGKGISPNIDFLKESEIKLNKGILVDEFLKTNIPNIYAAGDVAESYDLLHKQRRLNPLWPYAIKEGKVAGLNILGAGQRYEGALGMNAVEFFDLPVISMGITQAKTEEYEELLYTVPEKGIYKKVVLRDKKIVGMIFLGEIKNSGLILRLIKEEADVSKIKSELLSNSLNYLHIKDLVSEKEEVFF
jgi:NAD(P)H-nitrite reductase large subunit